MRMESRNSLVQWEQQKKGARRRPNIQAMRIRKCEVAGSAGSVQRSFAFVDGLRFHPLVSFLLCFVFADSVALLDTPDQLVLFACNRFEVAIGELAPLLAGFALQLFPVAFDSVPVHSCCCSFAGSGARRRPFVSD